MADPAKPDKKRDRESGPTFTPTLRAFLKRLKRDGKLGRNPLEWLLAQELREWERVNGRFEPVPGDENDVTESEGTE